MTGEAAGDGDEAILIAYGSNLPSGAKTASQAFAQLVKTLEARGLIITKISRLWRSKAWPDPKDPDYVNAVLAVESSLPPHDLLHLLHAVERDAGRTGHGAKNAPRVLDLDLIAHGRRTIDAPGLVVPHPRSHERGFVMGPLAEILPGWIHPRLNINAKNLYKTVSIGLDAHPMDEM